MHLQDLSTCAYKTFYCLVSMSSSVDVLILSSFMFFACAYVQTSRDVLFALMALILGPAAAWVVGHSQDTEFVEFFHSIWSA
jgi:hypothetical protein